MTNRPTRTALGRMFWHRVAATALTAILMSAPTLAAETFALGDIEIVAPFSRATLPNSSTGGVYFSLANSGTTDDVLLSASTPLAQVVQLHDMKIEDNVMRMSELPDGITVPAGSTIVLKPSGMHLMLVRLDGQLVEGETLPLTLSFKNAGDITVDVPIGSIAQREAP